MNEPRNRATLLLLSIQLHSLWFSFTWYLTTPEVVEKQCSMIWLTNRAEAEFYPFFISSPTCVWYLIPASGLKGTACSQSALPHKIRRSSPDSGTHFCYRLSRPQDHSAAGKIRSI
jgi:hypothetical protein